jgi:hypothetical protein
MEVIFAFFQENGGMIRQVDYETVSTFDEQFIDAIKSLWADNGIQEFLSDGLLTICRVCDR